MPSSTALRPIALLSVQVDDLFFDGASCHQPILGNKAARFVLMAAAGLCFLAVIETGARAAMLSMLIVSGFIALFLCLTISKSRRLIVILGVTIILVLG
ncbi:MAG TPA: hypothetical protein DIC52_01290, partial [Candidatus Latescibacteria bacterium]|nr:hypothetical protein [Candidatus Latescibacterota bacterium]